MDYEIPEPEYANTKKWEDSRKSGFSKKRQKKIRKEMEKRRIAQEAEEE